MMKCKRLWALLLCLCLTVCLCVAPARAAGFVEPERDVSLTLHFAPGDSGAQGVTFRIYKVADVSRYAEFTLTADFVGYSVSLEKLDSAGWKALAQTLSGYVRRDNVTPTDSGKTDAAGTVRFPSAGKTLTAGLYLVTGKRHEQKGYSYEASPFMVMLPAMDMKENEWMYEVTADAKFGLEEIPPGPDTDETPNPPVVPSNPQTPGNSKLPQTGQLWWPVPMLLAAGLLFIVIGLIRRRGAMDED